MAAGDGLISMTPSSIAHSGTSASINADGGVDFSAVTSLSLNGVFTSDYDNYLIVLLWDTSTVQSGIDIRFRASGSDASGSDYTEQMLEARSTVVDGVRNTSQTHIRVAGGTVGTVGYSIHIYGPFLAQPTALRSVSARNTDGAYIQDWAGTHSLSTSYDGFSLITTSDSINGNIHVFGYEE